MAKQKNTSAWSEQLKEGDVYSEMENAEELFDVAYDAISKFSQKASRRIKNVKKGKHCWS